jgi:hypothetical protein
MYRIADKEEKVGKKQYKRGHYSYKQTKKQQENNKINHPTQ